MSDKIKTEKSLYLLSIIKKVNTVFFGLIATFLLHRIFNPAIKGEYEYINNIIVMLTAVLNMGVSLVLPNYVRKNYKWTLSTFYVLCLVQFIILTVISISLGIIFSSISIAVYGVAVACGVFSLQMLNNTMVYNFKITALANIIGVIINAVMLAVLLLGHIHSIVAVIIVNIIKELFCAFICLGGMIKQIKISDVHFREWPKIILTGIIPMATSLLVILNYKVDILELKWLGIADYDIGIYSVGLSIADYVLLFSDVFKDVLFNKTAESDNTQSVNFALRLCSTVMIVAYLCIVIFGKVIITILYGSNYLDAFAITVVVMFGTFSMMYFKLLGTLYVAQGKWWFYFFTLLGSVLINVGANIILIPLLGIYGAAVTSVLSYSFAGAFFVIKYLRTYKLSPKEVLLVNRDDCRKLINIIKKRSVI